MHDDPLSRVIDDVLPTAARVVGVDLAQPLTVVALRGMLAELCAAITARMQGEQAT